MTKKNPIAQDGWLNRTLQVITVIGIILAICYIAGHIQGNDIYVR